jgi:hypothetical protein
VPVLRRAFLATGLALVFSLPACSSAGTSQGQSSGQTGSGTVVCGGLFPECHTTAPEPTSTDATACKILSGVVSKFAHKQKVSAEQFSRVYSSAESAHAETLVSDGHRLQEAVTSGNSDATGQTLTDLLGDCNRLGLPI